MPKISKVQVFRVFICCAISTTDDNLISYYNCNFTVFAVIYRKQCDKENGVYDAFPGP